MREFRRGGDPVPVLQEGGHRSPGEPGPRTGNVRSGAAGMGDPGCFQEHRDLGNNGGICDAGWICSPWVPLHLGKGLLGNRPLGNRLLVNRRLEDEEAEGEDLGETREDGFDAVVLN